MTRPITAMESQLPTELGDINEEDEEEKGISSRENGRKGSEKYE